MTNATNHLQTLIDKIEALADLYIHSDKFREATKELFQAQEEAKAFLKEPHPSPQPEGLVYEDRLPPMTDDEYAAWFKQSRVIDGVRMGPQPEGVPASKSILWKNKNGELTSITPDPYKIASLFYAKNTDAETVKYYDRLAEEAKPSQPQPEGVPVAAYAKGKVQKPNAANMKYIYELDGEKHFKGDLYDDDMKSYLSKRTFTLQDFFDGVREIVKEARRWWDRECSQEENERLKKKYGITHLDTLTDERIVTIYLKEEEIK